MGQLFTHYPSPDQKDDTFVKFLLPSYASGMIIGSGGSTVADLMAQTSAIIKFSPGRELYPGTTERVCCISGSITNICTALTKIFGLISDPNHVMASELQEYLRRFKMLVSNIAAGMAIGKSGLTIKAIQQECSCKIQVTNKDESNNLPERMLTIDGEPVSVIVKAVGLILEHTKGDPDSAKWRRLLSYSSHSKSSNPISSAVSSSGSGASTPSAVTPGMSGAIGSSASTPDLSAAANSYLSLLQSPAYAAYGAHAGATASQTTSPVDQAMLSYMYAQSLMSTNSYFGQFNPVMVDGVNLMIPGATLATFEIAVPEVMVTSVFGAGNKLLTDLMQSTGARIQLSNKGEYIPGTYNRKLTIAGPILSVQAAHMIVLQKIVKDQDAFRKQGLV